MIVLRDTRSDHPSLRYTIGSAAGTKWKLLSFHMHSNGLILVVYCIILCHLDISKMGWKGYRCEDESMSIPPSKTMLSEYELLNLSSGKRYTRVCNEDDGYKTITGSIHSAHEGDTMEHGFIRPSSIRNLFDLFMWVC